MRYLIVKIWNTELGRLTHNPKSGLCVFTFNPELKGLRPDVAPILLPLKFWDKHQIAYGDSRKLYQGLPPFIADSLPDSWGNELFDQWVRKNKISRRNITPLYKLMFIGNRGMGALEFEPAAEDLTHNRKVDINALHELSLKIFNQRGEALISPEEQLTLQTLLSVGTSAGGRQIKAIIAIDKTSGEIRSGQIDGLDSFDYYLLKLEDDTIPSSEIEISYYDMAISAGISMADSRLLNVEGANHFLTRRFDRSNGKKIHMQTLAALNPDAVSYEDLFQVCRQLNLYDKDIEQIFRRMVFNVMSNNTDDHNKNFSFLLSETGNWELSPAYDMTFIFNRYGTDAEIDHCLSINGKYRNISQEDLIKLGRENSIRNPKGIIDEVSVAIRKFPILAKKYQIKPRWSNIISETLNQRLCDFGYSSIYQNENNLIESGNSIFSNIKIHFNNKGHYVVSTIINGKARRRFIRPNMELYKIFENNNFLELPETARMQILESLFSATVLSKGNS